MKLENKINWRIRRPSNLRVNLNDNVHLFAHDGKQFYFLDLLDIIKQI